MADYIHISKFSSLNFEHSNQKEFEDHVSYCQKVGINDTILIQFAGDATQTYSYAIVNEFGVVVQGGEFVITPVDETLNIYEINTAGLTVGIYQFQIFNDTELLAQSSPFCVTEDINHTVLLTYTNEVNDFDTLFLNNTVRVFNFRFEGGFLNEDNKYLVEGNSFRNQHQEIKQLYQTPYKTSVLTMGKACGVPDWVAEKVNLIFCLSNVYVNYIRHIRSENEIPERSSIAERYPFYNFKLVLERQSQVFTTGGQIFSDDWVDENSSFVFIINESEYYLPNIATNKYQNTLNIQYVGVGGELYFILIALKNATIIQITRDIAPLSTSEYNFDSSTGEIALLGDALSEGETIYIIYGIIVEG